MKNKKLIRIVIIALLILIASIFIIKLYNKPPVNIAETEAKYHLSSQKLINDFITDEDTANKKYVKQIIQISGKVLEADNTSITIKDENSESTILCSFASKIENNQLKKGQKIVIKGLCTGYLLDVVLIDCVLIPNK